MYPSTRSQDTTYMVYPRINKTHCKIHHDAVGPTLAANLLADAVRAAGRQRDTHSPCTHSANLQQQSGGSSIPPARKLSVVARD